MDKDKVFKALSDYEIKVQELTSALERRDELISHLQTVINDLRAQQSIHKCEH